MTKCIVITGLDGSGKSSVLEKISIKINYPKHVILNVPKINIQLLNKNKALLNVAKFINNINEISDLKQNTALKAIALFSSMLIFKDLINTAITSTTKLIFCERHPLIDTSVYASFYAQKAKNTQWDNYLLSHLNYEYKAQINYIINKLPEKYIKNKNDISSLGNFIFKWFVIENKYSINHLRELFSIELPDKIYFLKADTNVLYNRIKTRHVKESHETTNTLNKLNHEYMNLLNQISKYNINRIEYVDANNLNELNSFPNKIINELPL